MFLSEASFLRKDKKNSGMKYSGKDSWCSLFGWARDMEANFSKSQRGKYDRPENTINEKSLMMKCLLGDTIHSNICVM